MRSLPSETVQAPAYRLPDHRSTRTPSRFENTPRSLNPRTFETSSRIVSDQWKEDREELPTHRIYDFDVRYAGVPRKQKFEQIRSKLKEGRAHAHLLTSLDDIAWLFNLRGRDTSFNPVFYSYAVINMHEAILFIDPEKLTEPLLRQLNQEGVTAYRYDKISEFCSQIDSEIFPKSILLKRLASKERKTLQLSQH